VTGTDSTRADHGVAITKAGRRELEGTCGVLARAFFDDPVMVWAVPDDGRRRQVLPGLFAMFAQTVARHDEIYHAPGAAGAALWVPPGQEVVSAGEADGFGRSLERLAGGDAARILGVCELLDERHPQESHYYLWFLGVEPGSQSRGIGSALLTRVLQRCDRDGVPAYLEASSARNRALYERHGFQAVDQVAAPGAPPMWPMWRDPLT
jgi:ribosomal protein S18 acetylase RimI-like enzyme